MTDDPTIKDVLEVVEFIRDHAATKEDLKHDLGTLRNEMKENFNALRSEMKVGFESLRNEMIEHVDGFIALYQKHEVELAAV